MLGLPDLRLLLGYVHGEQPQLPDGGRWAYPLPGNGTIPMVYSRRLMLAKETGKAV